MSKPRGRMNLEELMDDLWLDEPISITLRNGVTVRGHVHSRHRKMRSTEIPNTVINEGDGATSSVPDTDIQSVRLEDVEWRRTTQTT